MKTKAMPRLYAAALAVLLTLAGASQAAAARYDLYPNADLIGATVSLRATELTTHDENGRVQLVPVFAGNEQATIVNMERVAEGPAGQEVLRVTLRLENGEEGYLDIATRETFEQYIQVLCEHVL